MNETMKKLRELAPYAAGQKPIPANFTEKGIEQEDIHAMFRDEFKKIAGSINKFNQHKYEIYDLIIERADEILPANVIGAMGIFADIQVVGYGQQAIYQSAQTLGKARAKKFLTRVAEFGVYQTFRLDSEEYTVKAHAIGTGISIDAGRLLSNQDTLASLYDVASNMMTEALYVEVQRALRATIDATGIDMPAANRVIDSTFDSAKMFKLMTTVKAYAGGAGMGVNSGVVIFAPPEFIGAMGPDAIVPVGANYQGIYHPQDIDRIHYQGYINIFRGAPIVEIPQSFIDEKNVQTQIDPQLAYVFPTGGEKVVKIVLEGGLQMYDHQNRDQSLEIMMFQKMGAAIHTYYNWGIYQNTGITQTMYDPYPNI